MRYYTIALGLIIAGMIIGISYSFEIKNPILALVILALGTFFSYLLNRYYNLNVETVSDERTELIEAKSARNSYFVMSIILFAQYAWLTTKDLKISPDWLLIPLVAGALVLIISQYYYSKVM